MFRLFEVPEQHKIVMKYVALHGLLLQVLDTVILKCITAHGNYKKYTIFAIKMFEYTAG